MDDGYPVRIPQLLQRLADRLRLSRQADDEAALADHANLRGQNRLSKNLSEIALCTCIRPSITISRQRQFHPRREA